MLDITTARPLALLIQIINYYKPKNGIEHPSTSVIRHLKHHCHPLQAVLKYDAVERSFQVPAGWWRVNVAILNTYYIGAYTCP